MMIQLLILVVSSFGMLAGSSNAKDEKEVLAAMQEWRQAMLSRDRAALELIYAPGLSYTHSNGRQENKAEAIEAVMNGKERIASIEMTNTSVTVYGKTALVKCKVDLGLNNEGKSSIISLDVLHVWIKFSSRWQMVARQATRLNP
jgi:ketosteroid isomerase-like protein